MSPRAFTCRFGLFAGVVLVLVVGLHLDVLADREHGTHVKGDSAEFVTVAAK
jgi:hypothetical protein